jgi:hypothetical protein
VTAETLTPDGGRLALKPAQETALAALERGTLSDLTRAAYEEITGVSRSQAAHDLADLVRLGLLERVGAGRATHYRLARGARGRPRNGNPGSASRAAAVAVRRAARAYRVDRGLGQSLLAGAILVLVVTFAGLLFLADLGQRDITTPQAASVGAPGEGSVAEPALVESRPAATDARVALRLTAAWGSSWIEVRRGSADGRILFLGTLASGRSLHVRGKRIWLRLGAPAGLRARLDGRSLALPDRTSTILVRRGGLRVLDLETPAPPPAEEPVVVSQPVAYMPPSSESSGAGTDPGSPPPSPDDSPSPDPRPPADPDPDPKSDRR